MKKRSYLVLLYFLVFALVFACEDDEEPMSPQLFADFSASLTSIQEGASIQFTDESLGDPTSWEWTFEGGSPSTSIDQNPAVSYANAGVYSVCLLAVNGDNKDKTTKIGYIVVEGDEDDPTTPQLFADFSATSTSIQEGASIQFTDESLGDPTSWEWTFEGGSPSTSIDQNPAVSYANAGVYSVCLLAVNGDNKDKTTKIGYIVVEGDEDDPTTPQLFADFSATSTSIQEGASIQFTDESLGD
ncbi:MAG: PKD domain-containing protein, partial [Flammeovirgaceae bacterium]